jgi:hypothetical protein
LAKAAKWHMILLDREAEKCWQLALEKLLKLIIRIERGASEVLTTMAAWHERLSPYP